MDNKTDSLRSTRQYNEKRDFARMPMSAPLLIKNTDTGETITGTCTSLSGNGIDFESPKAFQIDTQLHIELKTPNSKFQGLTASIQVLRSNQNITSKLYQTAAKIIKLL